MKIFMTLGLAALLANPDTARAYSSSPGPDPKNASTNAGMEIQTRVIVKSATAGSSQQLDPGVFVGYDQTAVDGYTVTRAVSQNQRGLRTLACATLTTVATGDTSYHPCISQGVAFVQYDGTGVGTAIEAGRSACVRSDGVLRGCNLANAVEATANTGIVPLKSATDSGSSLPVIINLQ